MMLLVMMIVCVGKFRREKETTIKTPNRGTFFRHQVLKWQPFPGLCSCLIFETGHFFAAENLNILFSLRKTYPVMKLLLFLFHLHKKFQAEGILLYPSLSGIPVAAFAKSEEVECLVGLSVL